MFVLVNLKAYPCDPVAVAAAAADVHDDTDAEIAIAPQAAHLPAVAETGVETWAQHVSPVEHGSHTGSTLAEAADDAGLRREYGTDKREYTKTVPTMHSLRHGFAVQSIKNGMNLKDLQDALGHEDIRNTLEYLKALKENQTERLRKHSPGPTNDEADTARTQPDIDQSVFIDQH